MQFSLKSMIFAGGWQSPVRASSCQRRSCRQSPPSLTMCSRRELLSRDTLPVRCYVLVILFEHAILALCEIAENWPAHVRMPCARLAQVGWPWQGERYHLW
jgi:hypothetical protein